MKLIISPFLPVMGGVTETSACSLRRCRETTVSWVRDQLPQGRTMALYTQPFIHHPLLSNLVPYPPPQPHRLPPATSTCLWFRGGPCSLTQLCFCRCGPTSACPSPEPTTKPEETFSSTLNPFQPTSSPLEDGYSPLSKLLNQYHLLHEIALKDK